MVVIRKHWVLIFLVLVPVLLGVVTTYSLVNKVEVVKFDLDGDCIPDSLDPSPNEYNEGGECITDTADNFIERFLDKPKEKIVLVLATLISLFCLSITTIILLFSLPIHYFSGNKERRDNAGKIVKKSLGFLIGSAGCILGTLSFS